MAEKQTKKRKYAPSFVVAGDGPTITDDEGVVHELQPDSVVRFRKEYPWERAVLDVDGMTDREYIDATCRFLRRQVIEWNWTDADSEPYPQPDDKDGFFAAVRDLQMVERAWLVNHCWESAVAVPNG